MNKAIGVGLLVGGIIMLAFGINASESVGSDLSRLFTGAPTDKSIWLLVLGAVATVLGAVLTFRTRRA